MCGGGGMVPVGPTPEETQNAQLSNTLLNKQIGALTKEEQDAAYKRSPEYLNAELNKTRTAGQKDFTTSKGSALNTARQNIIDQFTAFGDPAAAQPYLDALNAQAESIQYRPGGEYRQNPTPITVTADNFDANRYLASNPDVQNYANEYVKARKGSATDAATQHFQQYGSKENRTYGASSGGLIAPTADTWDDPNALLSNDFGASGYIAGQRKTRKDTAFNTAKTNTTSLLQGMGLDDGTYNELLGLANNQLQTKYDTSGLTSNDYSNVFDPQAVLDSVLSTGRTAKRTQYGTKVNAAFGGIDPNTDFADTADDQYINSLVGKQYGDASSAIERAYKRGALTDMGYNSGLSYLGDQNKSAISSAQSLGGAVLQKNRDALGNIVSGAKTAASGWDFGQQFDVDKYLNDYTSKKGALAGSLEGDVTNALAGQNWFDIGDALTKAGYAQGAQNTAALTEGYTTPGAAGLAGLREKDKTATRGLGGVGVF